MTQRYPAGRAPWIVTCPRFTAPPFTAIMYAMPYGDDLDARFNELVAQIGADERRRMRAAASKAAGEPHPGRRLWLAAAAVLAVIAAAGLVVAFRPDLLTSAPPPPPRGSAPVFAVPPSVNGASDPA
ncbi:hypothetical protein [Nonomuraea sp. NPDC049725]|uniref:hypothetical protein n=1 Tax=Nonomuraea sp. NPDC049725 TaxID=3154508 RepID=UPI00344A4075